jgi:hypothetical protein
MSIIISRESFEDGAACIGWPSALHREGQWCPVSKDVTTRVEHCYLLIFGLGDLRVAMGFAAGLDSEGVGWVP